MLMNFRIFENMRNDIVLKSNTITNKSGGKSLRHIGAGTLPICKKTGRILVAYRSIAVDEPHTWAVFGGRLNSDDSNPQEAAKRELYEETGFSDDINLIPVYVYKVTGFEYHNFIGIVDNEFEPDINWETEKTKWVNFDDFQKLHPKHFGLKALLNDNETLNMITNFSK